MALTLNKVASNTASITLQVRNDEEVNELNITYYPARITHETFAHLKKFDAMMSAKDEDEMMAGFDSLEEVLSSLIKSWDFYEDDEKTVKVPTTPARLKTLPTFLLMSVLQGILGDARPNQIAPMMPN